MNWNINVLRIEILKFMNWNIYVSRIEIFKIHELKFQYIINWNFKNICINTKSQLNLMGNLDTMSYAKFIFFIKIEK